MVSKEAAALPPVAGEGREYIVIGPHCWARHKELKVARRNARVHLPGWVKKPAQFYIIDVPTGAYIDDMGYTCWTPADGIEPPSKSIKL